MSSSETIVSRVQSFVAENKKAVIIGSAVAAVALGGAVCYAASCSGGTDKKDKRSKKGKGKKKKTVNDEDGPLLEERKPKTAVVQEPEPTPEEVETMTETQRSALAAQYKQKGNAAYQARQFSEAASLYTKAIVVSPKAEPVFFSNRAACYMNLNPPDYALVVSDCDEALLLDRVYLKAMNRRATALEALGRHKEALRDFTASAILDHFKNKSTGESVERVLKAVATKKAQEMMKERPPRLPSHTFINAYFAAFRARPHPAMPETPSTGDNTLMLALDALDATRYQHAFTLVGEALEHGVSTDMLRAEALNVRGTFKFLMGDIPGAKADLQTSIDLVPSFTQSLVKIASVYMEQSEPTLAFKCFDDAEAHNPSDPDIFYHRGQVLFILSSFAEAAQNYTKSTELDPTFVFSHIQYAVAEYKQGNNAKSMEVFRTTLKLFPQRSEPFNYYGELLLDQACYEDAIEKFDKAIELEQRKAQQTSTIPNVLPLVNKGLALYQLQQQLEPVEAILQSALTIDPECDAAVATLAQLSLQQGRIDKAVEWFGKQAELARTEQELIGALTYEYATRSQVEFLKEYPEMAKQLGDIAMGMGAM